MEITAIITHWYPERTKYLRGIIDALKAGSVVPDEIIIFNNLPEPLDFKDVTVINSNHNFSTLAKQFCAVAAKNKCILFQDNDLMVGRDTVKELYEFYLKNKDCFVGKWGKRMAAGDKPYSEGQNIAEGEVDVVAGALNMCGRELVIQALTDREKYKQDIWRVEDIAMSFSNTKRGGKNYALNVEVVELPEENIGLWHEPEHFIIRDKFVKDETSAGNIKRQE